MKYNNNVRLLGKNIELIQKKLGLTKEENKLENHWNIFSYEISEDSQIEEIFKTIKQSLTEVIEESKFSENGIFSFTIIYSLDNIANEKENLKKFLNIILEDKTEQKSGQPEQKEHQLKTFYLPFFIFLLKDENDKSTFNEFLEGLEVDERNISCYISPLNENIIDKKENEELIKLKILKIFSYFFQLGDNFKAYGNDYKLYKQTKEKLFPINILLLGKTQVGKSTFLNTLLKEKRSKEGGEGFAVTQRLISYHLDETPLIINDIEGFSGEENIKNVIKIIKVMQARLNENELNLVIYIIDYNGQNQTFFNDNEYPIFKQLTEKFDKTHFLFVCTKSKEDNNNSVLNSIQSSFFRMINKGLKNKNEKENIINAFNYMYYCIKKDILYDEMDKKEVDEEQFEQMDFFEKLNLKFKNYEEVKKNKEMIETILKLNETIIFVNLKRDEEHKTIFGMNKVSKKIREAFQCIQQNNMIFINDISKVNQNIINDLDDKINQLKKRINEDQEMDEINNENLENGIIEESKSLVNESFNEKLKLEKMNETYRDLIECIKTKKYNSAKVNAEKLKNEYVESIKNKLNIHKALGFISGILPFFDLLFQYFIKKSARKKIAGEFKDNLVNPDKINKLNKEISLEEQKTIEDIKNKTNDKKSDILKTIFRTGTVSFNVMAKIITNTFSKAVGGVGLAVGILTGGFVMNYDINSFLDFYGKRLLYKLLVNLSFEGIEKYLKDNFEQKDKNDKNDHQP